MISNLLTDDLVITELATRDKDASLAMLAARLTDGVPSIEESALRSALEARERQSSTGLGDGFVIPHARLAGIDRMAALLARSDAGIDWQSPDGKPVHLILMLVGPADQPGAYLKILAAASRLLGDASVRTRLMSATCAGELQRILRAEELRNGAGRTSN